ncbi:MAG TPA: zf-HC2 domain-containing protein [Edaphobacter sp.]|nr:zf-HC2 domain-containing protein [Edaphobacter sp.]
MTQTPQTNRSTEHLNVEKLNAFIDGELPPNEQQGIEQHLTGCHACTLRVLSTTQLKAATARAGHRFAPPPEALARFTAQLRLQPQTRTKKPVRIYSMPSLRPLAWAALGAAILLTVSLFGWRQFHQTNNLAAELLDQHLATLSSGATPQVLSTDRHTVKPWFQGRLPFSFNLPDGVALPPDTTLKGADLTYLNGQPAALLLFTIHKHEVSIFLMQRTGGPILSALPRTRSGFTIHSATTHDLRIVAVSDVNPADLDNLIAALVKAQSPV